MVVESAVDSFPEKKGVYRCINKKWYLKKFVLLQSNSKKIDMAGKYYFFEVKTRYFNFSVTLPFFCESAD